jgi:hypothetical protein
MTDLKRADRVGPGSEAGEGRGANRVRIVRDVQPPRIVRTVIDDRLRHESGAGR